MTTLEVAQHKDRIEYANTLRGMAALAVIVSHYYGVFWLAQPAVESLTNIPALSFDGIPIPQYILWLHKLDLSNFGAYGVALFFLISGFVIPFSLHKSTWLGFLTNRIFRIYPVYIVGFTITLLAIAIGSHVSHRSWPFSHNEVLIHYIPGVRDLLWSRNIDGIIWTLEIEIKFYLICALLISLFRKNSLKVFFTPAVLFIAAILLNHFITELSQANSTFYHLSLTYIFSSQFIIFMFIGVTLNYLHIKKLPPDKAYLIISVLFLLFCIQWSIGPYKASIYTAWSYLFAIITFLFANTFQNPFRGNSIFNFFANISYPLYVIHGVAGYTALSIMLKAGVNPSTSLMFVTITAFLLAYLIHRFVELPSQVIGKRLGTGKQ